MPGTTPSAGSRWCCCDIMVSISQESDRWGHRWLASTIPISELILKKCDFFLDTVFEGFYTFVNCKVSLAGSMSTRQRENRNNGNQESSSEEASEEGSQKGSKEEVVRQRNRQHTRGTPKASPEVFLGDAESSVFMRFRRDGLHREEAHRRVIAVFSLSPATAFRDLIFRRLCAPYQVRPILRPAASLEVHKRMTGAAQSFGRGTQQTLPKW